MSEDDAILVDMATRIFHDHADPRNVVTAKDEAWRGKLWGALEEAGLTTAWVPEEQGGAGAGMRAGFAVLSVAGRHAVAVPLAETLLAGWLLAKAGLEVPSGMLAVAPARDSDRVVLTGAGILEGSARNVSFASLAEHLAVLVYKDTEPQVALVRRDDCIVEPGRDLASDPRDRVVFDGSAPVALGAAPGWLRGDMLMLMGAAVRAVLMAGALETVLETTVAYTKERVAFERPIAKFQAVQHSVAKLAGEVAAALAAAGSAADTIADAESFDNFVFLEAASAKIRVGEAAGAGAAIAHQMHGAIGFTNEHILHRFTQRLWSWRDDFGSEAVWAVRLGNVVAAQGADNLWPMLASR